MIEINGRKVIYTLCQKNIDVSPLVTTYCMLPAGHTKDCLASPTKEQIKSVLEQQARQ